VKQSLSCTKCAREYCKECGQDQHETFGGKEGEPVDECEHCTGKDEGGEQYHSSDDSAGEESSGEGGCEICQKSKDEEKMLLCDYCDLAFHMYCLKPPITTIPEDDWYCDDCKTTLAQKQRKEKAKQERAELKRKQTEEKAAQEEATKRQKLEEEKNQPTTDATTTGETPSTDPIPTFTAPVALDNTPIA